MASFGENLRREREMRGVSLAEIADATKISARFLKALEAEQFSKVPGGIFTRSFIRAYAKYLGLDEERVLAEYQLIAQAKSDVDLSRLAMSRSTPARDAARARVLVYYLLAAALLSGGYTLFHYSRRVAESQAGIPNPVSVSAAPSPGPSAPAGSSTSDPAPLPAATGLAPAGPTPPEQAALPGQSVPPLTVPKVTQTEEGLVLQVAATERAWVAVDADGKTTLQRVLSPNEVETFKAKESFDVTTGNAQGIILTLNGETLRPLGRRGEVKSVHLSHDDLKKTAP